MSRLTAHKCIDCGKPITQDSLFFDEDDSKKWHRDCYRLAQLPRPAPPPAPIAAKQDEIIDAQTPKPEKPKSQDVVTPAVRKSPPKPAHDVANSRVQAVPAKRNKR